MAKYQTHPQAKTLTLCTHTFESRSMHRHKLIYKHIHALHGSTHTHTHTSKCCLFFMLPYFTQRQVCRYMVSITLILPHCCSPDHINTNLEQAQGSMRPELCWNQARDFHHHQGDSFIIYHAWWVTLIITLQTGLQLTARIARVMRSHTSDIDKYDLSQLSLTILLCFSTTLHLPENNQHSLFFSFVICCYAELVLKCCKSGTHANTICGFRHICWGQRFILPDLAYSQSALLCLLY